MNAPHPPAPPDREWIAILALTIVGAALRLAGFGRLGLDHFDEGIYASAGMWSLAPGGLEGIDPGLIPYAPPGYPILVGLAYSLYGPTDRAAIAVSIVAGIAAVPLAGWLGQADVRARRRGGCGRPRGGVDGASRPSAGWRSTDATFLVAWLAAMIAGGRFLEKPGPWRAVVLGLAVGAAQLVKYNGWLAGAIVAATALLGPVVSAEERFRPRVVRTFGWGLLAAVVAAIVEWPWFRFVEAHGGYAALLAHQRGYFDGLGKWPANWLVHLRELAALDPSEVLGRILGPTMALLAVAGMAALEGRRSARPASRCDRPGHRRPGAVPVLDDLVDRPGACRLLAPGRLAERPPGRCVVARALGPDAALPSVRAALAPARSGRVAVGRLCHRVECPMGRRGRSAAEPGEGRRSRARHRRGLDRAGTHPAEAEAPAWRDRGAAGFAPQRNGADRRADPEGRPGDPGPRPARDALLRDAPPRGEGHRKRPATRLEGAARARGRGMGARSTSCCSARRATRTPSSTGYSNAGRSSPRSRRRSRRRRCSTSTRMPRLATFPPGTSR